MDVSSLFQYTAEFFVIISLAALAGMIAERSGIVNIAIEGFMTLGALAFAIIGNLSRTPSNNGMQVLIFVAIFGLGMIFSLMHSFVAIRLKCDQIISGTAINLFMQGFALFIVTSGVVGGDKNFIEAKFLNISFDSSKIFSVYLLITIIITAILGFYFTFTRTGNRHIAAGENPNALDAVGISVNKYRYLATAFSGGVAAIAGAFFVIVIKASTFYGSVDGFGFIGLALMIIGQWRVKFIPLFSLFFAFIFAFVRIAGASAGMPDFISKHNVLLKALPFILSLVAMVAISKWSRPPAASGKHFDKSKR
ncbi:general nucleoside transport system permease protein [Spiroplasma chinense]|uniref:General nucleoside transport system permease protein n=1 Tax=Spiroplasma chinense TaxID=216932 RepID=A0A5B9Y2R1_9MOLU|nr:ABC transporter permease [Spiroplasma chinense]QEH61328.1 general nucleoside transport system permease protein [Spiroplasma chinense]